MPSIFISYRREDTAGHAGRIFDRLREKFGRDNVFMDVAGIDPGVDFVEAIDRAVGSCDVLLVIIGRKWLTCTDASGKKRLDDPKDFIRLETATALRRNIRVIPVLVQGAAMPGENDLPEDLKTLARRQATEIDDTHWDSDTGQLVDSVANVLFGGKASLGTDAASRTSTGTGDGSIGSTGTGDGSVGSATTALQWTRNKFTWIIAAAVAVVVALAVAPFPGGPKTVTAPDLIGISLDQAAARLNQARLKPGAVKSVPSDRPASSVIEQDPPPGTRLPRDSAVNLVLSEGKAPEAPTSEVPNLVGLPLETALQQIKKAGLMAAEPVRKESHEFAEGTILAQAPGAGAKLKRGTAIELVVAKKAVDKETPPQPALAVVPTLVGQPLDTALGLLKDAGLTAAKPVRKETPDAQESTVLEQTPRAGTTLQRGTAVELVVAALPAEPDMVTVPDVRGVDAKEAIAILRKVGLKAAPKLERIETTKDKPGTVLKQNFRPGSQAHIDAIVVLAYAVAPREQPPADIILPDFTGSALSKVQDFLREAGLVLGSVREKASDKQRPGTVLSQSPPANTRMKKGEKVLLLVAASRGGGTDILPAPLTGTARYPAPGSSPETGRITWKKVSGAASYTLELDCSNCCVGKWCSDVGKSWKVVRFRQSESPGWTFNADDMRGRRWRVWAVDKEGREGEKSPWRTFRPTPN